MKLLITFLLVGLVAVSCSPKRGGGRGGNRPCGGKDKITSCKCGDDDTDISKEDLKEKCPRKTKEIQSCTCEDGETWTRPEKPDKTDRPEKPCGTSRNVDECTCEDGETYDNKRDLRRNCKRKKNPIESCTCKDGETWTPEEGPDRPNRPGRPCGGKDKITSCKCGDDDTDISKEDLKEKCPRKTKPIQSCTCDDGETWTRPEKPDETDRPEKPCGKSRNVDECTCEDGETYDNKRDLRRNCKRKKNPIESCKCKDETTWEAPN